MKTPGDWVEINQLGRWLPFLVTAVHDADTVSGVAFSGQPAQVNWRRPSADFAHVAQGDGNRQWREKPKRRRVKPADPEPNSGETDPPPAHPPADPADGEDPPE